MDREGQGHLIANSTLIRTSVRKVNFTGMDNTMLVSDITFRLSIAANAENQSVFSLKAPATFQIAAHTKTKKTTRANT